MGGIWWLCPDVQRWADCVQWGLGLFVLNPRQNYLGFFLVRIFGISNKSGVESPTNQACFMLKHMLCVFYVRVLDWTVGIWVECVWWGLIFFFSKSNSPTLCQTVFYVHIYIHKHIYTQTYTHKYIHCVYMNTSTSHKHIYTQTYTHKYIFCVYMDTSTLHKLRYTQTYTHKYIYCVYINTST